nr:hypothetical protein [Tanacetum cinerariifolium]
MQKNLARIAKYFKKIYKSTNNNLRTSSNSKNKNVDMTLREYGHFAKECKKPKRVKDSVYHKEKRLLCKQAEQGVPLQAEQYDWLADKDEEVDEQELEAHYCFMAKIQEVPTADSGTDSEPVEQVQNESGYNVFANHLKHSEQSKYVSNTCLVEMDYSNVTPDSPDICEDDIQNEQNDVENDDERVALAILTPDGEETIALERESRSKLNKDSMRPYDYTKLNSLYEIFKPPTQEYETQLAHANKIRRKTWRKSFVKSKPNIHKNGRFLPVSKLISKSRQAYNVMKNNINHFKQIVDNAWIKHSKDLFRTPTAHDIGILIQTCLMPLAIKTQSDSLKFVHELKQEMHADLKYVESLEKEIDELESDKAEFSDMYDVILLSKQTEFVSKKVHIKLLQCFAKVEKHLISLEIALQNYLSAQMQDKNIAISELKKLIEHGKAKSVDTKFDRPSVVRQPNAQRIPKPSVLGKPTPFSNSLDRIYFQKTRSVPKAYMSEGLSKPVTAQTLPQVAKKAVRVIHKPNVRRPQLKSNQLRDKVLPNNSQLKAKKTQVEVHPRIPSVSNKTKSVTACKDNLNSKTLNANVVCATCNKCLVDSNHFACVTKMLNGVHARTKKPTVVPISTRKPKSQANKSIATPHKKKVALKPTNQKPQGYFKVLYENTSNDQFAPILGYGDLVQGNVTINWVYYVECLNHNLFSVGQFCDADLEVAFRKSTCFVRDFRATPTQAWLWHRRLSHLNFDYINLLSKKDIMIGLPKLKHVKDQLCSSCELSKAKRSLFKSKAVPSSKGRLNLLHMDLCGPMRVASINGKKYILKASDYDNPDPVPQRQDVYSSTDAYVPSQQELDLLFGPLYDEFFNAGSNPSTNVQSTQAPSSHTNMHAEKNNNDQAEEGEHVQDVEFTNPFCAPAQEEAESSSHHIDNTNAKYTLEILYKHGMNKGQSIGTPMTMKPKLDADLSGNPVDQTDYHTKIRSLMYLTYSRLDIVQADSSFELTTFLDADHAGCIDSHKSTSRGIQFLGDKLVSWMSKKHNGTVMSSAEAEYMSLSASYAQVMWMRTQLQDYGFNYKKIPLYRDSQSAIAISCNPVQHSRTKHIHTQYHFIKEQVENGIIELYFVRTEYQLADMFTKALPEDRFKYLVRRIGMRCLTPIELEVLAKESA